MKVAVIKYNAGNTESVKNALKRLGIDPILTDRAEEILSADKVIFPGVGEASSAMEYLKKKRLDEIIKLIRSPFLGICLGMHLLCQFSEENDTECLGIFPYRVRKLRLKGLKVPHIGWNNVFNLKGDLFNSTEKSEFFYFVHGFYVGLEENTVAVCDYGISFSAAIQRKNFYAVQFHPEKSGFAGERVLKRFLEL